MDPMLSSQPCPVPSDAPGWCSKESWVLSASYPLSSSLLCFLSWNSDQLEMLGLISWKDSSLRPYEAGVLMLSGRDCNCCDEESRREKWSPYRSNVIRRHRWGLRRLFRVYFPWDASWKTAAWKNEQDEIHGDSISKGSVGTTKLSSEWQKRKVHVKKKKRKKSSNACGSYEWQTLSAKYVLVFWVTKTPETSLNT